jgi:hypothetical protein
MSQPTPPNSQQQFDIPIHRPVPIRPSSRPNQGEAGDLLRPTSQANSDHDYFGFAPGMSLVQSRVSLLTGDLATNTFVRQIKMRADDSGELYDEPALMIPNNVVIKPVLSREVQRQRVAERAEMRRVHRESSLSTPARIIKNKQIALTNYNIATAQQELTIKDAIRQVRANKKDAKEAERQQQIEEQRAGLAEQATRHNAEQALLAGLGLTMNPAYAAAKISQCEEDGGFPNYAAAYLRGESTNSTGADAQNESMDEEHVNLGTIGDLYTSRSRPSPPSLSLSLSTSSSTGCPRTPTGSPPPSPTTARPTLFLNLTASRDTYQVTPNNPLERVREFLQRAAGGRTSRERSVAEGLRGCLGGVSRPASRDGEDNTDGTDPQKER